jgi:hypothetical protein
MKRILFYLSVALVAFSVGLAGVLAFEKYLELTPPEVTACFPQKQELRDLAVPLPPEEGRRQLPPGSLPAELRRIDEVFKRRCRLPTDWYGEWPTIQQLEKFSVCNEEWAKARREAVKAERANYLIQY